MDRRYYDVHEISCPYDQDEPTDCDTPPGTKIHGASVSRVTSWLPGRARTPGTYGTHERGNPRVGAVGGATDDRMEAISCYD